MKIDIRNSIIPGCFELIPEIFNDERGSFVKIFNSDVFLGLGLEKTFIEEYFSRSSQNVLRGLHFQLPPKDCVKIVYCPLGEVLDVIVDLRIGSPTYGKHDIFNLNQDLANILYIPSGIAHGFYTKSKTALMMYKVSENYASELDTGIHWNSAGIPWQIQTPIISKRDSEFTTLDNFQSPFTYQ